MVSTHQPPQAPPPPPPPEAPAIPHLILGSLRYTTEFDVMLAIPVFLVFFFFRLDSYSAGGGGRMGVGARCRQLLAVWSASGEEITALCGADARDYLVVQRYILVALLVTSVPGCLLLLPIATHLGSDTSSGDENEFARTTVHHIPNQSPYLWAAVATSAVAVCAVETIADEVAVWVSQSEQAEPIRDGAARGGRRHGGGPVRARGERLAPASSLMPGNVEVCK